MHTENVNGKQVPVDRIIGTKTLRQPARVIVAWRDENNAIATDFIDCHTEQGAKVLAEALMERRSVAVSGGDKPSSQVAGSTGHVCRVSHLSDPPRCLDCGAEWPVADPPMLPEERSNAPHQARAVASRPECGCSASLTGGV